MTKLLGISGSLRKGSFNTALLRTAQQLTGGDAQLDIATLHGIPLYDGDEEAASGIPAAVTALKAQIIASDGVILCSPEYNSGMPGVMKNAFDWLSRPPEDIAKVFGGRPVAVLGATPSGFGTTLAQAAWLPVLKHLGAHIWSGGRLGVSLAHTHLGGDGSYDEETRRNLGNFVQSFAAWAKAQRRG